MIDNNIFFNSFFYNFLTSFAFLTIIFASSISISNFLSSNILKIANPHLVFCLIIALYTFFIKIFLVFNIISFFYIFFTFITMSFLTYVILNYKNCFLDCLYPKNKSFYFFCLFFVLYYFISILPLSDADSIASHLNTSYQLYFNILIKNLMHNVENLVLSSTETLLILSFILKSDNFGSQLNFFSLIVFYISFYKNKNFFYILLTAPLLIFFISTQKLQLFFGLLYLLLFILVNNNKLKSKFEVFIFIFLLVFYSSGKITYIIFSGFLYLFFCFKHSKNKNLIKISLFYLIICFFLFQFPILIYKFLLFKNPIAPFFGSFFQNSEIYNAFEQSLRSSEGWTEQLSPLLVFRPFVTINVNQFSTTFGLCFLLMGLNFKKNKELYFIPYLIIISILITGQILPRYYLEAFLIMSFYCSYNNYFKLICVIQGLAIFFLSFIFLFFSYKFIVQDNWSKILFSNNFSYSYYNSIQLNKKNFADNVLALPLDRPSIFFNKNIYSYRSLNILNNYNKKNEENFISFVKTNNIKIIVDKNFENLPSCMLIKSFDEIYFKVATRNFLVKDNLKKFQIGKIIKNEC